MKQITLAGTIMCVMLAGLAHSAHVDFDRGTHFSGYKTYRWVQSGKPSPTDADFPNQLMQQRIAAFIDEALAARGLKRVTAGGDLLVSYQVNVSEWPQYTTFSDPGPGWGSGWGYGWGWGWGGGFSTTTVWPIFEGKLIVNMVDAHQNQLVFQGTSTHTVSSKPDRNTRKMLKAVNEIFEKYPPRS